MSKSFFLILTSIVIGNIEGQRNAGLLGSGVYIGIEESICLLGGMKEYYDIKLVNRGFGRLKIEKQVTQDAVCGLSYQRQGFTVTDKYVYPIKSSTLGFTYKNFYESWSIAPMGGYRQLSVLYTSNRIGLSDSGTMKFGGISAGLDYGRTIPFILDKLMLNFSLGFRMRVLSSAIFNPRDRVRQADATKADLNRDLGYRNIICINFGLSYAL
jgi:hypothetical protein